MYSLALMHQYVWGMENGNQIPKLWSVKVYYNYNSIPVSGNLTTSMIAICNHKGYWDPNPAHVCQSQYLYMYICSNQYQYCMSHYNNITIMMPYEIIYYYVYYDIMQMMLQIRHQLVHAHWKILRCHKLSKTRNY